MSSLSLGKDLVGLEPLSADQIRLSRTAEPFKEVSERPIKKVPALRGKTIVNLFFEASTRNPDLLRIRREAAQRGHGKRATAGSSCQGRDPGRHGAESRGDAIDMVVIRHGASGAAQFLGQRIRSNVIKRATASTSTRRRACLDILTLRDRFKRIEGLKIAICGDILHSRVARQQHLGPAQAVAPRWAWGPATLLPRNVHELGVTILPRIEDAIQWADALNILRLQLERMQSGFLPSLREYNRVFGVTSERLAKATKDLLILHPGPMNRGVEIDSDVADGPHSVILPQVTNGVAVRMAVLYLLAGGSPDWAQSGGGETTMRPSSSGGASARPSRNTDRWPTVCCRTQVEALGQHSATRTAPTCSRPRGRWWPGLIDLHVPCGSRARKTSRRSRAARWRPRPAVQRVCAMPNTDPVPTPGGGRLHREQAQRGARRESIRSAPSPSRRGPAARGVRELVGAGAVAVSDDGKPVVSSHLMRRRSNTRAPSAFPWPTIARIRRCRRRRHARGLVSTRLGLKGVPAAAERSWWPATSLGELTGGHVHLCHMSTPARSSSPSRQGEGLRVTAEACPHHFTLTHEACEGYNTTRR